MELSHPDVIGVIQYDLFPAFQAWHLRAIVKSFAGNHYLVCIIRGADDSNSMGTCGVWGNSKWNEVVGRPITALDVGSTWVNDAGREVPLVPYSAKTLTEDQMRAFSEDASSLITMAQRVVEA